MSTAVCSASLLARLLFTGACLLATVAPAAPAAAAEPGAVSAAALTGEAAYATAADEPAIRLAQATPQSQDKRARPAPAPRACTSLKGVERRICMQCDGVQMFKRIGCQQRVFWSACKGKRLFEDPYCQAHQDQGPPRGEGG